MKDVIIVSGGNIQKGFALDFLKRIKEERQDGGLCLIAADKGLEFFMETGLAPDVIVGDFDSLSEKGKIYLDTLQNVEILRLKPEKDDSDTQSATNLAIQKGSANILLLGSTGSRLDHIIANLELLSMGENKGVSVTMADSNNYVTLIKSGTVLERENQFGQFVSFFPVGGEVEGLTLEGFKYPLYDHHLTVADSGLTVSNEIISPMARVTFTKGSLLMIMSRD